MSTDRWTRTSTSGSAVRPTAPGELLVHVVDMNIRRSIIGAVLAGASLVGVAAMASSGRSRRGHPTTATATGRERGWVRPPSPPGGSGSRTSAAETFFIERRLGGQHQSTSNRSRSQGALRSFARPGVATKHCLPDDSVPSEGLRGPGPVNTSRSRSCRNPARAPDRGLAPIVRAFQRASSTFVLGVEWNMRGSKAWSSSNFWSSMPVARTSRDPRQVTYP